MILFKSCSTLPIKNFFQIVETDDLRYLIKKFDFENDKIKLSEEEKIDLNIIWENIYFEYSELTSNHKLKGLLKKQCLIQEWETIYNVISKCIDLYEDYYQIEALKLINKLNHKVYKINLLDSLDTQIESLKKDMKGLKTKIKVFKIKLVKSVDQNKTEIKSNLEKDALYLEKNLDLKRAININKTPVKTWIQMIELSKEKAKAYGKN
jgi:hypothetical protein